MMIAVDSEARMRGRECVQIFTRLIAEFLLIGNQRDSH